LPVCYDFQELEAAHAREEGTAEERARLASRVADLESTLAKEREELVAVRGEMEELQAAEAEREKDKGAAANVEVWIFVRLILGQRHLCGERGGA
jgi:septal ring factor EnvC (AmiA/AmiB activator)